MKKFLLLSLVMPFYLSADICHNVIDKKTEKNCVDEQLNLVCMDDQVRKCITDLENSYPSHQWSKTFKNLCKDISEEGNVASHELVDKVIQECLQACKTYKNGKLCPVENCLNKYKNSLDAGEAQVPLSDLRDKSESEATETRSKTETVYNLCIRCLNFSVELP